MAMFTFSVLDWKHPKWLQLDLNPQLQVYKQSLNYLAKH